MHSPLHLAVGLPCRRWRPRPALPLQRPLPLGGVLVAACRGGGGASQPGGTRRGIPGADGQTQEERAQHDPEPRPGGARRGSRKEGVALAIASMPVRAEQPLANAATSSRMSTVRGEVTADAAGSGVSGAPRASPTTIRIASGP